LLWVGAGLARKWERICFAVTLRTGDLRRGGEELGDIGPRRFRHPIETVAMEPAKRRLKKLTP